MREIEDDTLKLALHDLLGLTEGSKIVKIEPLLYKVTVHRFTRRPSSWGDGFMDHTDVSTYEVRAEYKS